MKKTLSLVICFILIVLCPISLNANNQYTVSQVNYLSSVVTKVTSLSRSTQDYVEIGGVVIPAQLVNLSMPNSNGTVQAWLTLEEMTDEEMAAVENNNYDVLYPTATLYLVGSETARCNCHSYAWYSTDLDTNHYLISDPSPYYTQGSYCSVDTPQIGDIICYFDMDTTDSDENIHSGIVIGIIPGESNNLCGNSDKVIVRSKWGIAGIYEHNGYECPYTAYNTYSDSNMQRAEYVKYYRFNAHTFDANSGGDYYSSTMHYQPCEKCGHRCLVEHNFNHTQFNDDQHHAICTICAYSYLQNHDLFYEWTSSTQHAVICDMCGYIGLRNHEFNSSGNCTLCG